MPWANDPESRRRSQAVYGDPEYKRNRAICLRQAAGRCQSCGKHARLQCDHIIAVTNGGTHHLSNLQALCKRCHGTKTGEQHGWHRDSHPAGDPEPTPRTAW
jgi:5-methylcytosine-specific restriction protein A